jgi:ABC-type nitrate/sulfonate/bicarbonate transport system substrate-binding protein
LRFSRFIPVLVAALLAFSIVYIDMNVLPTSSGATNVALRVVYPDSLDESDVTDQFAFQILAAEGIHVTPTYYSTASLAYQALVSGQQDIAYDESGGPYGIGGVQQQTTCVGGYELAGSFIAIAGDGITNPSQLVGKTGEDAGPGTITRFLNEYWFKQAGIQVNQNAQQSGSVFLQAGLENYHLVSDLEKGVVQEIVVDSFILPDLEDSSINNTANGGPFHVIFYMPNNIFSSCYVVRDSWLSSPANQRILVEFLAAIYQGQRIFISNPAAFVPFAQKLLPYSPLAELGNASVSYPAQLTYWPYGEYNLQGDQNLSGKFENTVNFYIAAGALSSPVQNNSVKPFGIVNKYFELQALQSIGPYNYPNESWANSTFMSQIHDWVPSWMGT